MPATSMIGYLFQEISETGVVGFDGLALVLFWDLLQRTTTYRQAGNALPLASWRARKSASHLKPWWRSDSRVCSLMPHQDPAMSPTTSSILQRKSGSLVAVEKCRRLLLVVRLQMQTQQCALPGNGHIQCGKKGMM
jgi:hypothetical protein